MKTARLTTRALYRDSVCADINDVTLWSLNEDNNQSLCYGEFTGFPTIAKLLQNTSIGLTCIGFTWTSDVFKRALA